MKHRAVNQVTNTSCAPRAPRCQHGQAGPGLRVLITAVLGLPALACAQMPEREGEVHVGLSRGLVFEGQLGTTTQRRRLSALLKNARRRRPVAPAPRPAPPSTAPRPLAHGPVPGADDAVCLATLDAWRVPFARVASRPGVQSPIEITGPIAGLRLLSRAGRAAVMDCQLARALAAAAPIFRDLGVTGLSFSGAYDYRNVRGTRRLSGHAHGLAIDVHAFETRLGLIDVERAYERDPARWRGFQPLSSNLAACVGDPITPEGRLLRSLACQLRAERAFHLIINPDVNADHRNHFHLETYPGPAPELYSGTPQPRHHGRRAEVRRSAGRR